MSAPRLTATERATAVVRATKGTEPADELDVLVGEIHTTVLQNSHRVDASAVARLLDIKPGGRVRSATRPLAYGLSPDVLIGVHCPLATASGARVDGAGTVVARASISGGTVLQASSRARLTRAFDERRMPWSYYMANPGIVEAVGRGSGEDLGAGFLTAPTRTTLDLGAVSRRLIGRVQRMPEIDRMTMLRAPRTKLRFAVTWQPSNLAVMSQRQSARPSKGDSVAEWAESNGRCIGPSLSAEPASVEFVIHDGTLRTLRIRTGMSDPSDIVTLCEDLAFHDWLLSTVELLLDKSRIGGECARKVVRRFRPVIDHLLHLWMPGARVAEDLAEVWAALEKYPGFSREWASLAGQIRDQLVLAGLELSDQSARPRIAAVFQDIAEEELSARDSI